MVVLSLDYHTEYHEGMGDAVNIFLLPYFSLLSGLEYSPLVWQWHAVLGGVTLTLFTDTIILLARQKVPI